MFGGDAQQNRGTHLFAGEAQCCERRDCMGVEEREEEAERERRALGGGGQAAFLLWGRVIVRAAPVQAECPHRTTAQMGSREGTRYHPLQFETPDRLPSLGPL